MKHQKLTKKFFMSLDAGVFLVSNCHKMVDPHTYTPCFYEYLVPLQKRLEQWQKIKEVGADQRQCSVYSNMVEFKCELQSNTQDPSFPKFLIIEK
jgi:hypothetical protein